MQKQMPQSHHGDSGKIEFRHLSDRLNAIHAGHHRMLARQTLTTFTTTTFRLRNTPFISHKIVVGISSSLAIPEIERTRFRFI
jgi:hypothetical protein